MIQFHLTSWCLLLALFTMSTQSLANFCESPVLLKDLAQHGEAVGYGWKKNYWQSLSFQNYAFAALDTDSDFVATMNGAGSLIKWEYDIEQREGLYFSGHISGYNQQIFYLDKVAEASSKRNRLIDLSFSAGHWQQLTAKRKIYMGVVFGRVMDANYLIETNVPVRANLDVLITF